MSDSVQPHRRQPTRLPRPQDSPGKNTGVGCHFLLQCMKVKSESEVAQSCLTLRDPVDCSLPGSFVHGIFQARVLEWVAIAFSERTMNCVILIFLSNLKKGTHIFCEVFLGILTLGLCGWFPDVKWIFNQWLNYGFSMSNLSWHLFLCHYFRERRTEHLYRVILRCMLSHFVDFERHK